MAYLINRNVSGRVLCLHGILKYLVHHWGKGPYRIKDLYFDPNRTPDIHNFSPCAIIKNGQPSCKFLQNSASDAKCGNVNSTLIDTQKEKLISDNFNALDGLGFITRESDPAETTDVAYLTDRGMRFADCVNDSFEFQEIFSEAVSNYGPFVGLYAKTQKISITDIFRMSDIELGYPETVEQILFNDEPVILSTGGTPDTKTRTRSSLFMWGLAAGYFSVPNQTIESTSIPAQVKTREYLMSKKRPTTFTRLDEDFFPLAGPVDRPLSYKQLTKQTRALREQGQASQREATLKFETTIRNRRLAIVFLLSTAFNNGKFLDFQIMIDQLYEEPMFVIDQKTFLDVMRTEVDIAYTAGAPFEIIEGRLKPLCEVNLEVLCKDAPTEVMNFLMNITDTTNLFV